MARTKKTQPEIFYCDECGSEHSTEEESFNCCDDDSSFYHGDKKNEPSKGLSDYTSSNPTVEVPDKPTMDLIFDFSKAVTDFEYQLRGYVFNSIKKCWEKVTDEVGPDSFIKDTMTLVTSIVKETNFWTFKESSEVETILKTTNASFINLACDELEIDETKLKPLCAAFDNVVELFMGLVEKGHGSVTLSSIYAGVVASAEQYAKSNSTNLIQDLKNKLSFGGEN